MQYNKTSSTLCRPWRREPKRASRHSSPRQTTLPHRSGCYFDGLTNLTANPSTPRTIDFRGEMWIGRNRDQWTEPIHARLVNKRTTHQDLSITLTIGQVLNLLNSPVELIRMHASL